MPEPQLLRRGRFPSALLICLLYTSLLRVWAWGRSWQRDHFTVRMKWAQGLYIGAPLLLVLDPCALWFVAGYFVALDRAPSTPERIDRFGEYS